MMQFFAQFPLTRTLYMVASTRQQRSILSYKLDTIFRDNLLPYEEHGNPREQALPE